VGKESIELEIQEAMDKPEKMRDVLTKTFNVWVNQRTSGYMNTEKWANCGATKENPFPNVTGMVVFPGLDLSSTIDLTSVAFDIPLPNERFAVLSHSFMPAETLTAKRNTDKVPYDLWVEQGWITITPGAEVDYHFVLEYIRKMFDKYKWPKGECCFDRALATWLMHQVREDGFTPVDIPQSYTGLSAATKDFRAKVYNRKIIHDNNPVLSWAISNAVTRTGPSENIMLDKPKSSFRIDPLSALITAHVRAMVAGSEKPKKSVYEDREVRVLEL
jgi:phage terminase large subunit-like protein